MRLIYASLIFLCVLFNNSAFAQTGLWSEMTKEDIAAARALLLENHPAALPEFGDHKFLADLSEATKEASALADQVQTYQGYRAVLERFAAKLNDHHIVTRALLRTDYQWPGFLVALKSGGWRVFTHEDENSPLLGATLLNCDGRTPDQLADELIGPRASQWHIKAQKLRLSRQLFRKVDSPFSNYPSKCNLTLRDGSALTVDLTWKPLKSDDYLKRLPKAYKVSREMALEPFGEGWLVRLATLTDQASAVVKDAQKKREQIRNAPFVIIDMRGNGGGADIYVKQLAEVIFGPDKVQSVENSLTPSENQSAIWRVSEGNLMTLNSYIKRFTERLGADHPSVITTIGQRDAMEAALKNGEAYSTYEGQSSVSDSVSTEESYDGPTPKTVLITDRYCFSSCLSGMRRLLDLGVIHVGEETNVTKNYYEYREITLPSGISTFSTLQKYDPSAPTNIGPFTPQYEFDGSTDDEEALFKWIQTDILN